MKTANAKRAIIAKATGGDVHVGQTLFNGEGQSCTVIAIKGDTATCKMSDGTNQTVPLATITAGEAAGWITTTDPQVADAMRAVQDDAGDDDNGDPGN